MSKRLIGIKEAAVRLGVSISTLRHWDKIGRLPALRTPGGHRRYRLCDLERLQGERQDDHENAAVVAVYVRVLSDACKKRGDLERQKGRVLEYCAAKGYRVGYVLKEISSAMSENRPELHYLFELVTGREIDRVVIECQDRLTRFMFGVFVEFFASHGVTIERVKATMPKPYKAELATDMAILLKLISTRMNEP